MTAYHASNPRNAPGSHERTAHWVQRHSPTQTEFYSPSVPASIINESDTPRYQPSEISDTESLRSLPPRMHLTYADGRADTPISHWHYSDDRQRRTKAPRERSETRREQPRPQALPQQTAPSSADRSQHRRHKSSSAYLEHSAASRHIAEPPTGHSSRHSRQHEHRILGPSMPEEIRVLPSKTDQAPQTFPLSASHSRTGSHPKQPHRRHHQDAHIQQPPVRAPSPRHTSAPAPPMQRLSKTPPPIQHSQSQPNPSRPYQIERPHTSHAVRPAQAAMYAPPRPPYYHSQAQYPPETIVPTSDQYAPGVTYSYSAPVPSSKNHQRNGRAPHGQGKHGTHLASVHEEDKARVMGSRGLGNGVLVEDGDWDSHESGSTYYVLPTDGHKAQGLAREPSVYTATSTTKSPPPSPTHKKHFFARFLSKFSSDSSRDSHSHQLQRRHSTGSTERRRR